METTTETVWRPIETKLLAAAIRASFGIAEGVDDVPETDINEPLIEALVEYLDEADLFCDHSVGICSCSDLAMLNELRLWLARAKSCPKCGGEGIGDMFEVVVESEEFGEFTDYVTLPCETCTGKGTVPL